MGEPASIFDRPEWSSGGQYAYILYKSINLIKYYKLLINKFL